MQMMSSKGLTQIKIDRIERRFIMNGFDCCTCYEGEHMLRGTLDISMMNQPSNNVYWLVDIPSYTQYYEIKNRAEKKIKEIYRDLRVKLPKSFSIYDEYLGYWVETPERTYLFEVKRKGDKHVIISAKDFSHNLYYNKEELISFDAYKAIENRIIEIVNGFCVKKTEKQKIALNNGQNKNNQSNGTARLEYLTQKVIAGQNLFSDYRKNPGQTVNLVKREFLNHIDDATFIKIINNVLFSDMSRKNNQR